MVGRVCPQDYPTNVRYANCRVGIPPYPTYHSQIIYEE